jgi:hypothetical protein
MIDKLTEASDRIERMLLDAFDTRHPVFDDLAAIKFAIKDARRYGRLRGNYLRVIMGDQTGSVAFDIECEDTEFDSSHDGRRLDAAIDSAAEQNP